MIKSLAIKFFEFFSSPSSFSRDEQDAIVHRQKNIKLTSSQKERIAAMKEWSRMENIIQRVEEQRIHAAGATERAQRMKEMLEEMSKEDYSEYNKFLVNRPDKAWRVK